MGLPLKHLTLEHLEEARQHIVRLDRNFNRHGITADNVVCDAMKGLIQEAKKHLTETTPGDVRDAVLIASANRIERYEIAGYGVTKAFASTLGFGDDADILDESFQEKGKADEEITKIATGGIFRSGIIEAASHV